jgi:hypothetical protein
MGGEVGVGVRVGRFGMRVNVGEACKVGAVVAVETWGTEVGVVGNVGVNVEGSEIRICGAEPGWQATNSISRNKQK